MKTTHGMGFVWVLAVLPAAVYAVSFTEFATLDLPSAAVATFVKAPSGLGPDPNGAALLVTTFSPTAAHDNVLIITDLAAALQLSKNEDGSNLTVTTVDGEAVWPNQADPVAPGVVLSSASRSSSGTAAAILGAGGFFVNVPGSPSKSTGSVDLFEPSSTVNGTAAGFTKTQLSEDDKGFFYHKAAFLDANGDGLQDVVAARCFVPQYGLRPDQAELVVMLQPPLAPETATAAAGPSLTPEWPTTVLLSGGPDVSFVLTDLDGDGNAQVVATEYFVNQRLALYACQGGASDSATTNWVECAQSGETSNKTVTTVVLDESEGAMFNVAWVDLNGDGSKDLLVTSQGDKGSGKVLAYEQPSPSVPGAWLTEPWTKHVLSDGYTPTKQYLPGRGSPGTATAFPAPPSSASSKPWVVVSADDGGFVDLLVPAYDIDNWSYEKTRVVQSTGTVGTVAVGDVDGDGTFEVFVPLYDEGRLAMYSINV